jgi:hypothetical protein
MKLLERKTLYQDGEYVSFPNLAWLDSGTLACFFRHAKDRRKDGGAVTHIDPTAKNVFIVSKDNGLSFSTEPRTVLDDEMSEQDPCASVLSDGRILTTCFRWRIVPSGSGPEVWGPDLFARFGRTRPAGGGLAGFDAFNIGFSISASDDKGASWRHMPVIRPEGYLPGSAVRGNIVEMPDRTLLLPFYGVKKNSLLASCGIMRSQDRGETWRFLSETAFDPDKNFLEPALFRTQSGRLVSLFRTQSDFLKPGVDFDATYLSLHVSVSHDNGARFEPVREVPEVFGSNPFHALALSNGRVLVSYGYRRPPFSIRAKLCGPELEDLGTAPECIVASGAPNSDLGYTHAIELHDKRVLIAYYISAEDGTRRIEGAFLSPE